MTDEAWLPPLLVLADYGGDWGAYSEELYARYCALFASPPYFRGRRVSRKRWPEYEGKCRTFWHLITEGQVEENRLVDPRRCERVCWFRPLIEADSVPGRVRVWGTYRSTQRRWVIALPDFSYVVVLEDRVEYLLLVTAYPVASERQRERLRRECIAWEEAQES